MQLRLTRTEAEQLRVNGALHPAPDGWTATIAGAGESGIAVQVFIDDEGARTWSWHTPR